MSTDLTPQSELDPTLELRLKAIEGHLHRIEEVYSDVTQLGNAVNHLGKQIYRLPHNRPALVRNVCASVGLGAIGVGCWWFSPGVACIVIGTVLLGATILGTVLQAKRKVE